MRIPGILHRSAVPTAGDEHAHLVAAIREGTALSLQPWYVTKDAPQDLVSLLTLGVRPTCLDAASLHGLFVPPHPGVHVFRPRLVAAAGTVAMSTAVPIRRRDGAARRGAQRQGLVLHPPELRAWPDFDPVPDLPLLLEHAARCLPTAKAAVLLESAVNRRHLGLGEALAIVEALPMRFRDPLRRIRADAESGTETIVRWWLESMGVEVHAQVPFPYDPRRMDLLVGKSWVIECDSRAHHDDARSYAQDRERDLTLRSHGYDVTRLTWEQVFLRWQSTESALLTILRRGHHRRPPRR